MEPRYTRHGSHAKALAGRLPTQLDAGD